MELVESFYYAARSGCGLCACMLLSETVEEVRRLAKFSLAARLLWDFLSVGCLET